MVVEAMGRYAGWIALHAGMVVRPMLSPDPRNSPYLDKIAAKIRARQQAGRNYSIIIVAAEGALPKGGQRYLEEKAKLGER